MPISISGDGSIGPLSATEVGYLDGITSPIQTQVSNIGLWQSYTPAMTQPSAITLSIAVGKYTRIGNTVIGWFICVVSGTGTAGNSVSVTIPIASGISSIVVGSAQIYDSSTNTRYACILQANSTTTVAFVNDASAGGSWGGGPSIAVANADQFYGQFMYEVSS